MAEIKVVKDGSSFPVKILVNPVHIIRSLSSKRELILQFTSREVSGKYKGSYLGILWAFITPLIMLCIYTFVFSFIFKARWGLGSTEGRLQFAFILFCGLTIFNVFSECITRAPFLIISNPSYVKKVVFPVEILPVSMLGAALVHYLVSLVILMAGVSIFIGFPSIHVLLLPLILLPLSLTCLGLSWFLASLGVFIRDIGTSIGLFTQILLFLTPIFYPLSAIPQRYHVFIKLNILSFFVEGARDIIIFNRTFSWQWWLSAMIGSLAVFLAGYAWFMKSKKTFADVV